MSELFVGRVVADELRGPTPREFVDLLVAKELFDDLVDVIEEGLEPKKANELLRSAKGRADLFERACESYGALFEEDLREAIQTLRGPRLDQCLDVNLFNLREAWKIGTLLLPPEEAPLSRYLRVELVAVHPQATLPSGRKFGPESFGRHLLQNIESVAFEEQRITTRLERFGAGAAIEPSKFGDEAQEEAHSIVFLATIPERKEGVPAGPFWKKALKGYDLESAPDDSYGYKAYHAELALFFHPSWLEKPKRGAFDSTAFEDPL
ncbi:hypothetical protein JYK02_30490 [Corallococcus macrosporus]|uniref:Uncharacterized protein n=1 Tax=Corallococcus macrosporus TaxID=35 RepID=A0ABS3DKJ3_9BACT|nr:hypothetical protein [Corallococcus macrosporus]MBN8231850.1 hypothetical protein [Corallococcus macrosporus]